MAKVWIRADGSPELGLGHLVRCTALAHMIKDYFDICFICVQAPSSIREEILAAGFHFTQIKDEGEFLSLLTGDELVVIDHYKFPSVLQLKIKKIGSKLVCIDDLHDKVFFADLIINHAPGVKKKVYQSQSYTDFALGEDFSLLRPSFLKEAKRSLSPRNQQCKTVVTCFGGADFKNLTSSALNVIAGLAVFTEVVVVIGSANTHGNSILDHAKNDSRIVVHKSVSEEQMLCLLKRADLVVAPASGILYEAIAVGCRVISGFYTDNQLDIYSGFKAINAFVDAYDFAPQRLKDALSLSSDFSPPRVIDGNSDKRIAQLFLNLYYGNPDFS